MRLSSFAFRAAALVCIAGLLSSPTDVSAESPPPVDRLSELVESEAASFVPRTEADVDKAYSALQAAIRRLDTRLKAAPDQATGWRKYLKWDSFKAELAKKVDRDLAALDKAYARFAAGHEGLELVWFDDVRAALRTYLTTARAVGDANLKAQFESLMGAVPKHLEAYRKKPTLSGATTISSIIDWLEEAGQAQRLVAAIRHHYVHPNFFVQVSRDMIAAGIEEPMDSVEPVRDCILGASVSGTGHVTGQISVELMPSTSRGEIHVVVQGTVQSQTVGRKGPARVYNDGTTQLTARKPILLDAEGFSMRPATSDASVRSTVRDVQAGRGGFIERAATKRVYKMKCQAEAIASSHAEQQANRRADDQAAEMVGDAQEQFVKKVRTPLVDRGLFPKQLDVSTTADELFITGLEAAPRQLAAPGPPPAVVEGRSLTARVHQSSVNNFAQTALAGMIVKEERFQASVIEMLGELPDRLKSEEDAEPWGITFAPQGPFTVSFDEGQFTIIMRGWQYTTGESSFAGMNVKAVYNIEKGPQGFKAVRQGPLEIFPPGFKPGSGQQLSVRQQTLRTLLERRMGKIFEAEIVPDDIELPGRWEGTGKLVLAQWDVSDGWMTVAFNWVAAE